MMMNYKSTRNNDVTVTASVAISRGISEDGGLFVPESMPWLSYTDLKILTDSDYVARANDILSRFLGDFTPGEVLNCVSQAYTREKFETESIAPLYELEPGVYLLELWHGPTCAFKDMALQLLPHLLSVSVEKAEPGKTVVILVATSGDTGKAALEGFRDVPGTRILVFYPEQGVSPLQKLQMATQEGENVYVSAIRGNFDDAQAGVKAVFTDTAVKQKLAEHNMVFSSANSINWGRLVPQIVYYISSYCDLIKNNRISAGEHINIVVPTGNFGNILAAYYAKKMGIPINKLICASNANNVLTEFLQTGVYDRNRPFYTTISPSMDILISSNLERLLYDLSACDDKQVRGYMDSLAKTGRYEVDEAIKKSLQEHFWASYCDDDGTRSTIRETYAKNACVTDPHTAVALNVYRQYREKTGDEAKTIIASTASAYKFAGDVVGAIRSEQTANADQRTLVGELSKLSLSKPPKQISSLFEKPVRFEGVCDKEGMQQTIFTVLGID